MIPADVTQKLQALQSLQAVEPPTVKVYFNAEDPVKARYVEDTIKSQAQDANAALTKKLTEVALNYLNLIVTGGDVSLPLLGRQDRGARPRALERDRARGAGPAATELRGAPPARRASCASASSRATTSTSPTRS